MKMKKKKISLLVLLLLLATGMAFAATVEKISATVNGEAITITDLDAAMNAIGPGIQKKYNVTGTALRAKVLNQLIDEKLLEFAKKTAAEKNPEMLKIESHEVDSYIERVLSSTGLNMNTFEEELGKRGLTIKKYRENLNDQLLTNKFISNFVGRKVFISERELKDYFDKHPDEFKSVSSVHLKQISIPFTPQMTAENAKKVQALALTISKEAKDYSDFAALANKYNGKPYAVQGGDLGVISISDLQQNIAEAAVFLEEGQVSPPIPTNTGFHVIQVTSRVKNSAKNFSSVRDRVYDVVYQQKIDQALISYAAKLRKEADINIMTLGDAQ